MKQPNSTASVVSVKQLVKRYGRSTALAGVTFDVHKGEIFALLGPNGAGKTTTVEILEGYRSPDEGGVRVLGLDPIKGGRALKPRIGLMLQEGGLYPGIRVREACELFAAYYAEPTTPDQLIEISGLGDESKKQVRHLSGGSKQRLSLALALAGKPELLFLDEPTAGMDPRARADAWTLLEELRGSGVTQVLTTHNLEEAERLADRVAIIDRGSLVALGTPSEVRGTGGQDRWDLTTDRALSGEEVAQLTSIARTSVQHEAGQRYRFGSAPSPEVVARVAAWMAERQVLIVTMNAGRATLEDVFLRLTEQ